MHYVVKTKRCSLDSRRDLTVAFKQTFLLKKCSIAKQFFKYRNNLSSIQYDVSQKADGK
jgi:hypothetical protein